MTPTGVLAAAIARRINTHKHRCPEAANTEPEPWMTAAANDLAAVLCDSPRLWALAGCCDDCDRMAVEDLVAELERETP